MKPLNDIERLGIERAQQAVRDIVSECPADFEGPVLVAMLVALLSDEKLHDARANIGIAAAAIAALVENERAQARGERSVVA